MIEVVNAISRQKKRGLLIGSNYCVVLPVLGLKKMSLKNRMKTSLKKKNNIAKRSIPNRRTSLMQKPCTLALRSTPSEYSLTISSSTSMP